MVTSLEVVKITILVMASEMGQSTIIAAGLSARGPSPSCSPSKRGRDDTLSTLVERDYSKRACFVEGGE